MEFLTSTILNNDTNSVYKCIIDTIRYSIALKKIFFTDSKIYHIENKENITDFSQRSSKTYKIHCNESQSIFKSVENLVEYINEKNNTLFTLIPNDIDIIKYNTGDFFNRHSDFVPIKMRYVSYYTLLFCIDANCVGGETSLYLDKDTTIDFSETITPGQWLLFQNEIEHCGKKVLSGHKIILKANIAHINFSYYSFNNQFDKLVNSKNEIISDFLSKSENILPMNNLSDYISYRNCFKECTNVVPFQFFKCNELIDGFDIYYVNTTVKKYIQPVKTNTDLFKFLGTGNLFDSFANQDLLKQELDNDEYIPDPNLEKNISFFREKGIQWFNIGDQCPIIYFTYKNKTDNNNDNDESECIKKINEYKNKIEEIQRSIDDNDKHQIEKYTDLLNRINQLHEGHDYNGNDDDETHEEYQLKHYTDMLNKIKEKHLTYENEFGIHITNAQTKIEELTHNNDNINEIDRAISLMMCFFWINTLTFLDEDGYRIIDIADNIENLNDQIVEKIDENLKKIHEKELNAFGLEKLPDCKIKNVQKKFTPDLIKKIINSFYSETINYSEGGLHFCNETDYSVIEAEIYFGFVNF